MKLSHTSSTETWEHPLPLLAPEQQHVLPEMLSMHRSVKTPTLPHEVSKSYSGRVSQGVSCSRQAPTENASQEQCRLLAALGDHLENVGRTISSYAAVERDARNAAKVSQPGVLRSLRCTLSELIPEFGDDICRCASAASNNCNVQRSSDQEWPRDGKQEILSNGSHKTHGNNLCEHVPATGEHFPAVSSEYNIKSSSVQAHRQTSEAEGVCIEHPGNFSYSHEDDGKREGKHVAFFDNGREQESTHLIDCPPMELDALDSKDSSRLSSRWKEWRATAVRQSVRATEHMCMKHVSPALNDDDPDKPVSFKQKFLQVSEVVSAAVILGYSIVLALSVDITWTGWQLMEYSFTMFFVLELVTKAPVVGLKAFFSGPDGYWNMFDLFVVIIAVVDCSFSLIYSGDAGMIDKLSSLAFIKVVRLGRLARLIRLLRFKFFNELKEMIVGVVSGLRVLLWAVVLFFAFIYILAIALRQVLGPSLDEPDSNPELRKSFSSVPASVGTLFMCFTDGCSASNGTPLHWHVYRDYGFLYVACMMMCMLFVIIGLFNLIMATFVDNVLEKGRLHKNQRRARERKMLEKHLRRTVKKFAHAGVTTKLEKSYTAHFGDNMLRFFWAAIGRRRPDKHQEPTDQPDNPSITREEFCNLLRVPEVDDIICQLDIETHSWDELFDVLDADMSGQLEFDELIVGLMSLRGPAEKKDIIGSLLCSRATHQYLRQAQIMIKEQMHMLFEECRNNTSQIIARIDTARAEAAKTKSIKVIPGPLPAGLKRGHAKR